MIENRKKYLLANLHRYANRAAGTNAIYSNIEFELLGTFKELFSDKMKFRVRYRGDRAHNVNRYARRKQSTCLKKDAKAFSVYLTY
jgi:hypothetical protein